MLTVVRLDRWTAFSPSRVSVTIASRAEHRPVKLTAPLCRVRCWSTLAGNVNLVYTPGGGLRYIKTLTDDLRPSCCVIRLYIKLYVRTQQTIQLCLSAVAEGFA